MNFEALLNISYHDAFAAISLKGIRLVLFSVVLDSDIIHSL